MSSKHSERPVSDFNAGAGEESKNNSMQEEYLPFVCWSILRANLPYLFFHPVQKLRDS